KIAKPFKLVRYPVKGLTAHDNTNCFFAGSRHPVYVDPVSRPSRVRIRIKRQDGIPLLVADFLSRLAVVFPNEILRNWNLVNAVLRQRHSDRIANPVRQQGAYAYRAFDTPVFAIARFSDPQMDRIIPIGTLFEQPSDQQPIS